MRKTLLTSAALVVGLSSAAHAQTFAEANTEADTVVVTATRTAKNVNDVPATVSVITDEDIEEQLATDIKDLVRFEPGVSVRSSPSRFTAALAATGRDNNSGFNIRGIEGNRVLIQVDGIRTPDAFSFGAQTVGRGDYLDLDLLKSVEILRGPASALYGSDGLAGAVSFTTRDPDDFLAEGGGFAGRLRAAYAGADSSWTGSALGATGADALSALLAYSYRQGHEQENMGENTSLNSTRTAPNPQDYDSNSVLGKLLFAPSQANRFRLTVEHFDREVTSEVYTARAVPPLASTSTIDLDALDDTERDRVSFDHTYEGGGFVDRAFWAVYYQQATTRQFTAEDRNTAADRTRDTTFDNSVWGVTGQAEKSFATGGLEHLLLFGGDYSSTRQEGIRDGIVPPAGETFPTRAFPNTDYILSGLFLQDQISLLGGQLVIYPALRYDHYELTPEADAFYPPSLVVAGQSDSHVSPKLGIVAWPTETFGAFFNYGRGFKAPSPSQVNNGFVNPIQNYRSIANPDLEPETSTSMEAGVRVRGVNLAGARWSASATAFVADYDDFIEQVQVSGSFTALDPAVFQFVNLSAVTVSGVEARLQGNWENGFGLTLAAAKSEGDQTTGGVSSPLQSIDPLKLVAGLSYSDPQGRFGGQFIVTHSGAKDDRRVAQNRNATPADDLFTPDSFTILDLTAYWNVTENATVRLGAFNLTDEKYWWWGDVRGVAASSTVLDAYTQPGRNFSASVSYRF